jgi:hypothetical protein
MCLKIRCDGESKKFYKIFWELNRALDTIESGTKPKKEEDPLWQRQDGL